MSVVSTWMDDWAGTQDLFIQALFPHSCSDVLQHWIYFFSKSLEGKSECWSVSLCNSTLLILMGCYRFLEIQKLILTSSENSQTHKLRLFFFFFFFLQRHCEIDFHGKCRVIQQWWYNLHKYAILSPDLPPQFSNQSRTYILLKCCACASEDEW